MAAADACAAVERALHLAEGKLAQARRVEEEMRAEAASRREELRAVAEDLAAMTREQQVVNAELLRISSERDQLAVELGEVREAAARADAAARAARKEVDDVVGAYQELGAENRRLAAAATALERDGQRARLALDAGEAALAQAHARIRTVEENKQYVVDLQAFERQADGLARALAEAERAGEGRRASRRRRARSTRRGAGAQRRTRTRAGAVSARTRGGGGDPARGARAPGGFAG